MKRASISSVVAAVALTIPLSSVADEASDEAEIRAIWKDYASYRVAGNAEGWLGLWDENGIQMPPGMPARLIESLRPVLAEAWAANPRDAMEIIPEEIVVAGDWAYSRGIYTTDSGDANFEGKFMTILRRQEDGSWRIFRDIFNPNK